MLHKLKILQCYYAAILDGSKRFEIRMNDDRGFQKDDLVTFEPLSEVTDSKITIYFGDRDPYRITYVTNFKQQPGYVVFGFEEIEIIGDVKFG